MPISWGSKLTEGVFLLIKKLSYGKDHSWSVCWQY
jgi:hypothetical protein